MQDKGKLATYIDITKQTIVICWIALFSFWAVKLFGGNFFEILVENENFVKFSELVQSTWLKNFFSLITTFIGNFLIFSAISQKIKYNLKDTIIISLLIISMWFVVNFVPDFLGLSFWYGYFLILIFSFLYQKGNKRFLGFLAIILDIVFCTISMLIRNQNLNIMSNYMLTVIMSIDLYIMYALYCFYSILYKLKKEK